MKDRLKSIFFGAVFAVVLAALVSMPFALMRAQTAPVGPYGWLGFTTANTAADTATLTAQNMVGLLTGTPTAAANYTTPTATALCNLFPFVGNSAASGYGWDWVVKNTSAGANTITVVAGSGVTLSGTGTIAQNNVRLFKVTLTECRSGATAAATVFSLNGGTF